MPQFPPFQEWVVQFSEIINNVCLGIAALFGALGVWQWRMELVGKGKYEIARKILLSSLRLRDYIEKINFVVIWFPRFKGGAKSEFANLWKEYGERKNRFVGGEEVIRELEVMLVEGETLLRFEDLEPTKKLINLYNENALFIFFYYEKLAGIVNEEREPTEDELKDLNELRNAIGSKVERDQKIAKLVLEAKNRLGKYLK